MRVVIEKRCPVCKGKGTIRSEFWSTHVKVGDIICCPKCEGLGTVQSSITLGELKRVLRAQGTK